MPARKQHRWGVAVLLLAFLFFALNICFAQAVEGSGTLTIVGKNGAAGFCPLKHTDVLAGISGFVARVSVTQEFDNPSTEKIEAVYTFPLPQDAAVDSMTIQVGDRVVRGVIKKRDEANAMYQAAIQKGQVAALLNQERPNIFTQAVGNIPPGAGVKVTITFFVRLRYEDGTYEFSFPTVVGPRYIPGTPTGVSGGGFSPDTNKVPDASKITPVIAPPGTRAGHDISIALMLDAGVPIHDVRSTTHEIDVERMGASSAVVRLRNLAEIPNKDFILRYNVAGPEISEGLLIHAETPQQGFANGNGKTRGYFSLILQPPARLPGSDPSPKEFIFVMDSSGSMDGFPIEKSKQLILSALDGLYPRDTFNVIKFSGETAILFDNPVNPTADNLAKAKTFVSKYYGGGGTEMMKAIHAALAPSSSGEQERVVVFLTDGFVGNDMQILGEIKNYPKVRVFSYGIGSSVNRHLLDKMAEEGRGEVEYVSAKQDNKEAEAAAHKLYERLRAPLLTDISFNFGSLAVEDVYPQPVRDLFSGRPVYIIGRYTAPGKGVIRLQAKRAGQSYVREIPVEFPANAESNLAIPKLWARERIDALMASDWAGNQVRKPKGTIADEITALGLEYGLMTQYTSFVAIEEQVVTDGGQPKRIDVPVDLPADVRHEAQWSQSASAGSTATVSSSYTNGSVMTMVEVTSASVGIVESSSSVVQLISPNTISDLPVQSRSIIGVAQTLPGIVGTTHDADKTGQLSQNGLRTDSNDWIVDGLSTNVGVSTPSGLSPTQSTTGKLPASNAWGGTNSLIPMDVIQEVSVKQSNYTAEYGNGAGAQINVVSKAGTNALHGTAAYYFGNDVLNANDWFSNHDGVPKPRMRQNNFTGTFGGPVMKNKTFFFAAYDGVRALLPQSSLTTYVPTVATRNDPVLSPGLRSLLGAYPISSLPEVTIGGVPQGYAPFRASISNPIGADTFWLRLDQNFGQKWTLSGRATIANSDATNIVVPTQTNVTSGLRSYIAHATAVLSPRVVNDMYVGYTRNGATERQGVYAAYGAVVPPNDILFAGSSAAATMPNALWSFWNGPGTPQPLSVGTNAANIARQWSFVDHTDWVFGPHTLRFGGDFRYFFPSYAASDYSTRAYFGDLNALRTNAAADLQIAATSRTTVVSKTLSLFVQDDWKVTRRLTLNYGLRWEFAPAPHATDGESRYVTGWQTPGRLAFAPAGTPAYKNNYTGFAPRIGFSYDPFGSEKTLIRAGFGIYYDLPSAAPAASDRYYPNFRSYSADSAARLYPFNPALLPAPAAATFTPPYPAGLTLVGVAPDYAYPRVYQYNVGVQRELPGRVVAELNWVGNAGRRLIRQYVSQEGFGQFLNPQFPNATLFVARNDGIYDDTSDYNAMQIILRRQTNALSFNLNYTWAHAIDTASDLTPTFTASGELPANTRAASSFDRRHAFNATFNYKLPKLRGHAALLRALANGWAIDAIVRAQSGMPGNVFWSRYMYDAAFGPASLATFRADRVPGVPLWLVDANSPGGRRLNYAAFAVPACGFSDAAQACNGSLPRNGIVGLATWNADMAVNRRLKIKEGVALIARLELFNLFNHPNFSHAGGTLATVQGTTGVLPVGYATTSSGAAIPTVLPYAQFGMPSLTAAQAYGASTLNSGLNSVYQNGGPRVVQFALKLQF